MDVCAQWLADDFLTRHGFHLTSCPDGRRVATRDELTFLLDPPCGHDPDLCPPHLPAVREIGAVA